MYMYNVLLFTIYNRTHWFKFDIRSMQSLRCHVTYRRNPQSSTNIQVLMQRLYMFMLVSLCFKVTRLHPRDSSN